MSGCCVGINHRHAIVQLHHFAACAAFERTFVQWHAVPLCGVRCCMCVCLSCTRLSGVLISIQGSMFPLLHPTNHSYNIPLLYCRVVRWCHACVAACMYVSGLSACLCRFAHETPASFKGWHSPNAIVGTLYAATIQPSSHF